MITYHNDLIQGTDAWLNERLGMITASQMGKLITPSGKVADNNDSRLIVYEKTAERITNRIEDNYQSPYMEMGHVWEGFARDLYSKERDPVVECGFITREIEGVKIGYSPDGLVGEDGSIEIKALKRHNHVKAMCEKEIPSLFLMQVQCGLLVSGRKWCDFIYHCNGMAQRIIRVVPDQDIRNLIIEATKNLEECILKNIELYKKNAEGMPFAKYQEISI